MHDLALWLADARAAHAQLTRLHRSMSAHALNPLHSTWATRGVEVYTSQSADALWSAICTLNAHLGGPSLAGEVQP